MAEGRSKYSPLISPISDSQRSSIPQPYKLYSGKIVVALKWKGTELEQKFRNQAIIKEDTGIVDFYPTENVAVIYLSEYDLVTNTDYKRKLAKLKNARDVRGVVIVELTAMSMQYLNPVQQFVLTDLSLPLIKVANQDELTQFLIKLKTYYDENSFSSNPFDIAKNFPPFDLMVLKSVQSIPKVGEHRAKLLLAKFKSITRISDATSDEMTLVVGRTCAESVWNFFH